VDEATSAGQTNVRFHTDRPQAWDSPPLVAPLGIDQIAALQQLTEANRGKRI